MAQKDYYIILGVSPTATTQSIQRAFRTLAKQYHPDRVGSQGTSAFQDIVEAYEVFSNPERREIYDRHLRPAEPAERYGPQPEPLIPDPSRYVQRLWDDPLRPEQQSILDDFMTIRPSFEALRARALRNFTGAGVPKGERIEDLNIEVILSPDEARRGGVLRLGVPVFAPCTRCAGTGHTWGGACLACMGQGMRALARERFERAIDALVLKHPRALAYAICGLYNFLQHYDGAALVRRKLVECAEQLAVWYECSYVEDHAASAGAWRWFGDAMTYANTKMPQALSLAYNVTGTARFRHIGLASLDFLLAATYHDGYFDFIGNQGWYRRGGARATLGQQPIEAGYTAEACLTAYDLTGEQRYLQLARAAAEWLLGRNRLSARLYDLATGACADGLDPQGPSLNQGAESVICALLTLLVVAEKCDSVLDEGGREAVARAGYPLRSSWQVKRAASQCDPDGCGVIVLM